MERGLCSLGCRGSSGSSGVAIAGVWADTGRLNGTGEDPRLIGDTDGFCGDSDRLLSAGGSRVGCGLEEGSPAAVAAAAPGRVVGGGTNGGREGTGGSGGFSSSSGGGRGGGASTGRGGASLGTAKGAEVGGGTNLSSWSFNEDFVSALGSSDF